MPVEKKELWNMFGRHPDKIGEMTYFCLMWGDIQRKMNELSSEGFTKFEIWLEKK